MAPEYTPMQVMLTLAFIADSGLLIKASDCAAELELKGTIATHLKTKAAVKDNWELVWGPCVYKFPLIARHSDNMIFVVQSTQDRSEYVLALSGTNPYELTDWIFEDFLVGTTSEWKFGERPKGARISHSAALSLSILQDLKPCPDIAGAETRLIDFLAGLENVSSLTVTGHSLGGEMASTAALWLRDTQGLEWDKQKRAEVFAYCFAAPTAGNEVWANYFHQRLGNNAHRIWNSLDVVPHAWQLSDMRQIPDLYLPQIHAPMLLKLALKAAEFVVMGKHYTQWPALAAENQPLQGSVNPDPKFSKFTLQMAYQHVEAYRVLVNIPDVKDITDVIMGATDPRNLL
jgi:Lipase (class 3)